MKTIIAFTLLVAAALAEPQFYYGGGVVPYNSGVLPYTSGVYPYSYGVTPYAYSAYPSHVGYPAQDTSRGIPQPVQDTAEVQQAKSRFAAEYAATVARNSGSVAVPVHSIHKRAVSYPVVSAYKSAYASPYLYSSGYTTPYVSTYASTPYASTPYVSSYNYGAYPYSSYVY